MKQTKEKEKTVRKEPPANYHYYKVLVDAKTGKLLSRYWHACQKCEEAAEDYCKKFGAKYYYSDPKYFAGGVACVSFADNMKVDEKEWQKFAVLEGDQYYIPACKVERDVVEIPNREYCLKDTWDTIYRRDRIQEQTVRTDDGQARKALCVYRLRFLQLHDQHDRTGRLPQGSRALRRAVTAEQKRLKLPTMTVQQLYQILEAKLPEGKLSELTPTFFIRSMSYYIGCAYPCEAAGLEEITPQQYRMNQDLAIQEAKIKRN